MSLKLTLFDDGRGYVERESETLVVADSVPDLVSEIWDLAIDKTITRAEAEGLLADVEAETGHSVRAECFKADQHVPGDR